MYLLLTMANNVFRDQNVLALASQESLPQPLVI